MTPDMEECTGKRDGWDEDETGPLTTGRAGSHADGSTHQLGDDEGCQGVRGAKADAWQGGAS